MLSIRNYGSLYLILSYFLLETFQKVKHPPLVLNLVTSTLSPQRCTLKHLPGCKTMLNTTASSTKGNSPKLSLWSLGSIPRIIVRCYSFMRDKVLALGEVRR